MGYFPVRYDSRVVNYDRRGFIRLATGSRFLGVQSSRDGWSSGPLSPVLPLLFVPLPRHNAATSLVQLVPVKGLPR